MSNIKGLGDYNKDSDKDKKDPKKKKQETYIGGEKSGLAVQDRDDDLEKLVSRARQEYRMFNIVLEKVVRVLDPEEDQEELEVKIEYLKRSLYTRMDSSSMITMMILEHMTLLKLRNS